MKIKHSVLGLALLILPALSILGCINAHVQVDPIEVKPITLNVYLKIQKEVDKTFDYLYGTGPATQPSAIQ
jgi:hypothetical protein